MFFFSSSVYSSSLKTCYHLSIHQDHLLLWKRLHSLRDLNMYINSSFFIDVNTHTFTQIPWIFLILSTDINFLLQYLRTRFLKFKFFSRFTVLSNFDYLLGSVICHHHRSFCSQQLLNLFFLSFCILHHVRQAVICRFIRIICVLNVKCDMYDRSHLSRSPIY